MSALLKEHKSCECLRKAFNLAKISEKKLVYEQTSIVGFFKADLLMHLGFDNMDIFSVHISLSKQ